METTSLQRRLSPLIAVEPNKEIPFTFSNDKSSKSSITINNISDTDVAFKIKVNKPDLYVIKPDEGIIAEGSSVEVEILMQPSPSIPQISMINDQFLIIAAPFKNDFDIKHISKQLKSIPAAEQQQWKLKVFFKIEKTPRAALKDGILDQIDSKEHKDKVRPTPDDKPLFDRVESIPLANSRGTYSRNFFDESDSIETRKQNPNIRYSEEETKVFEDQIIELKKEIIGLKQERDKYKIEMQKNDDLKKAQEQLVAKVTQEKTNVEAELAAVKNTMMKQLKKPKVENPPGICSNLKGYIICALIGFLVSTLLKWSFESSMSVADSGAPSLNGFSQTTYSSMGEPANDYSS